MDVLNRLFFGSEDWQTAQPQPGTGTPVDVPDPKTVTFKRFAPFLDLTA